MAFDNVTVLASKALELRNIVGKHRPEYCYQCAKCTSGCTACKVVPEYKPHEIVAAVNTGILDDLLRTGVLWACTECLKCSEYCPQQASPAEIVLALKNMSMEKGYAPPNLLLEMVRNVVRTGRIQGAMEIMSKDMEIINRDSLKLPKWKDPKKTKQYEDALSRLFRTVVEHG